MAAHDQGTVALASLNLTINVLKRLVEKGVLDDNDTTRIIHAAVNNTAEPMRESVRALFRDMNIPV